MSRSFSCAVFGGLGFGDAVGVDDQRTLGALPDVGLQFLGLIEGHPDGGGEVLGHGRCPEHQHVDSLVGLAARSQGAGDASGGVLGVPRFEPRADALFEVGDDARW